ncbi:hypothetical protein CC1G_00566 [Coprinopsis cinerea okayama7|uniref:Uncharacterized protein n=1 Tax=Coprinopsis cinerea (strain Okayama-7 / 130 / ATCC MYA-4618 / FGSC 9003) TaxID=240176 RepID=A8N3V4_COPC7|nr:hypothetical protein CC1G_00566 [Coprinopsis cinerea okayama7\|eukprot:XP_001829387.2 hypothetical protein CC1G_00566 [Coprinopsis cinerea okayama7\
MDMAMDVDMDAPHISTLREEESPPPQPAPSKRAGGGAGRKPKAPKLKVTEPPGWKQAEKRKAGGASDDELGEDQPDEEEDQLIDDDDTGAPSQTLARSTESTPKKPGPKKKAKKDAAAMGAVAGKKAGKEKAGAAVGGNNGPPDAPNQEEPIVLKLSTAGKKKTATPRKSAAERGGAPRGRGGKATKQRSAIPPALAVQVQEDAAMSEAASSPATAPVDLPEGHNDVGTPETETPIAPSSPPTVAPAIPDETPNLEGVAVPQYPLPTRPFPVQPPVKITSGFAPPMPLDRTGKKVRHWKVANREIRGIAGGRWFAKTWVGEKDSEYANAIAASSGLGPHEFLGKGFVGGGVGHHQRAGALSAPVGRGRGRGGSKSASAVPSRAGSVMPGDGHAGAGSASAVVRAPTKMRILQLPPSENGDSDMAPPEVVVDS